MFSDPVVVLKKTNYLKMIESVIKSPFDVIYFDARDEQNLIWYGAPELAYIYFNLFLFDFRQWVTIPSTSS